MVVAGNIEQIGRTSSTVEDHPARAARAARRLRRPRRLRPARRHDDPGLSALCVPKSSIRIFSKKWVLKHGWRLIHVRRDLGPFTLCDGFGDRRSPNAYIP